METFYTNKPEQRVKLIFNPFSGLNSESPVQLMDIIREMQAWRLIPEPYLIEKGCDLGAAIEEALADGITYFVVCGGDGTVAPAARALAGKDATLGIIPTGTQNNIAFSLGIPTDIPAAISLLREGRRSGVDIGEITYDGKTVSFLEVCAIGLISALFSSGDAIQHGNLLRIGDFLSAFVSSPPSEIRLTLDGGQPLERTGHVLLVANMPYVMRHNRAGTVNSYRDGLLDVLCLTGASKLNLVSYALTGVQGSPHIERYRARQIVIETDPPMPVMADGEQLGEGRVVIEAKRHALNMMTAPPGTRTTVKRGEIIER